MAGILVLTQTASLCCPPQKEQPFECCEFWLRKHHLSGGLRTVSCTHTMMAWGVSEQCHTTGKTLEGYTHTKKSLWKAISPRCQFHSRPNTLIFILKRDAQYISPASTSQDVWFWCVLCVFAAFKQNINIVAPDKYRLCPKSLTRSLLPSHYIGGQT